MRTMTKKQTTKATKKTTTRKAAKPAKTTKRAALKPAPKTKRATRPGAFKPDGFMGKTLDQLAAAGVVGPVTPPVTIIPAPLVLSQKGLDALPPALQTGQGRRWAAKVHASNWTAATMPAREFAVMASAISRRAVEALFDQSWQSIAKARGFDPNAKKTRAPGRGAAGLGLGPDVLVVRRTSSSSSTSSSASEGDAPKPRRALVDDYARAVRVDTLTPGCRFKTPDSPREGIPGHESRVMSIGMGSVSIYKTPGLGDYIAAGTLVVPLDEAVA